MMINKGNARSCLSHSISWPIDLVDVGELERRRPQYLSIVGMCLPRGRLLRAWCSSRPPSAGLGEVWSYFMAPDFPLCLPGHDTASLCMCIVHVKCCVWVWCCWTARRKHSTFPKNNACLNGSSHMSQMSRSFWLFLTQTTTPFLLFRMSICDGEIY